MSESVKTADRIGMHPGRPWLLRRPEYDRRSLITFLLLSLIIFSSFLTVWQISLYPGAVIDNERQRLAALEATHRASDLLEEALKTFAADLNVLTLGQNLTRLVDGNAAARSAVARDFEILLSQKPEFMQVRYMNNAGDEIVRVDRRNGEILVVEGDLLQNKASRHYFQQAIANKDSGIYVSPIDLNVEHGKIEQPWRPMLRLATSLSSADGRIKGITVINIAAAGLIANLERVRPAGGSPVQMLNEAGYWLAGLPDDRLWGFMYPHNTTLALESPEVWRRIALRYSGAFDAAGTHYVFATLNPGLSTTGRAVANRAQASGIEWTILATVPNVTFAGIWTRDRLPTGAAGLLVALLISAGWTHAATARRTAEAMTRDTTTELLRIERLAGLGGLVAGVAHELNTPIGNAVTVASTLSNSTIQFGAAVAAGPVRRSTINEYLTEMGDGTTLILRGLERAAKLITHFKQIAVDQVSEQRRTFRIADLVGDVTGSLQAQFRNSGVVLATHITSTAPMDGYPGPLGQILINLIANARVHGFDDDSPGRILVSACDLDKNHLEIVVEDSGKGIPPEILDRIFEPFFTTRLGHEGSGLGLSIVFNIVTNVLGGTIRAESKPGSGTRMIVRLPRIAPVETGEQTERTYNVA